MAVWDKSGSLLYHTSHARLFRGPAVGPIFERKNGLLYYFVRGDGFYTSSDAGLNWHRVDDFKFGIQSIFFDPSGLGAYVIGRPPSSADTDTHLYYIHPDSTWFRVDDLQPVANDLRPDIITDTYIRSLAFDLTPNDLTYPIMYASTNIGIFKSRDKGRSWTKMKGLNEPVAKLAIVHDRIPKLMIASTHNSGILISSDDGQTWEPFALGILDGPLPFLEAYIPPIIHYLNHQLFARAQGGWYRCADFDCYGTATVAPPYAERALRATIPVVEFYNSDLDQYFMTSDTDEIAGIESGQAGPNWSRTGLGFTAWIPLGLNAGKAVCRFYGSTVPGPNSHFFSASVDECDALHQLQKSTPANQPRWNFEGLPFMVAKGRVAKAEACGENYIPIYRAYNNGYARGIDSNHRFVADHTEIDKLVDKGWADEGIAFCALNLSKIS